MATIWAGSHYLGWWPLFGLVATDDITMVCLQECQVLSVSATGQVVDKINVHASVESSGYIVKVTVLYTLFII